jgi:hypothetical protein
MVAITDERTDTLADDLRMALWEPVRTAELERDADFPREGAGVRPGAPGAGRETARGRSDVSTDARADGLSHQRPGSSGGDAGGDDRPAGATGPGGGRLPDPLGAAHAGGAHPDSGGTGSIWPGGSPCRVADLVRALGRERTGTRPVFRLCAERGAKVERIRASGRCGWQSHPRIACPVLPLGRGNGTDDVCGRAVGGGRGIGRKDERLADHLLDRIHQDERDLPAQVGWQVVEVRLVLPR